MAEQLAGGRTLAVIAPNASLSKQEAVAWYGGIAGAGMLIAGLFASRGYWLVLPFAGLELLALGAAFWVALRDNSYREVVRIDGAELLVEAGHGRPQRRWSCPAAWARIELRTDGGRAVARLRIRAMGRSREIGSCLTGTEKERLAAHLRSALDTAGRDRAGAGI